MHRTSFLPLLCVGLLAGCGHTATDDPTSTASATGHTAETTADTTGAVTAGSATSSGSSQGSRNSADPGDAPETDMQLTALSKRDIALYLQVMHVAAERVRHFSASDITLSRRAKAIVAAAASGKVSNTPEQDSETLGDSLMLRGQMDLLVVQQRHLDARRYEGIQSAIEETVSNPAILGASCGGDCPEASTNETPNCPRPHWHCNKKSSRCRRRTPRSWCPTRPRSSNCCRSCAALPEHKTEAQS